MYDYLYQCNKCGETSQRSILKNGVECKCSCEGWQIAKRDLNKYNYICAECGNIWIETTDGANVCTKCNSLDIVISYGDINIESYEDVQINYLEGKNFTYHCSCGQSKVLYSDKICNVACNCGELMKVVQHDNIIDKLKVYRKIHKLSQRLVANKVGCSRSMLAMAEIGQRELPDYIRTRLMKMVG